MTSQYELSQAFTHRTKTHDFEIAWTSIGDSSKPPLVFIHGTPWSSFTWHDLTAALKSRYHVYLYDHPGFGKSPQAKRLDGGPSDLDPTLEIRAEASAALFRHWNFQKTNMYFEICQLLLRKVLCELISNPLLSNHCQQELKMLCVNNGLRQALRGKLDSHRKWSKLTIERSVRSRVDMLQWGIRSMSRSFGAKKILGYLVKVLRDLERLWKLKRWWSLMMLLTLSITTSLQSLELSSQYGCKHSSDICIERVVPCKLSKYYFHTNRPNESPISHHEIVFTGLLHVHVPHQWYHSSYTAFYDAASDMIPDLVWHLLEECSLHTIYFMSQREMHQSAMHFLPLDHDFTYLRRCPTTLAE